MIIFFGLEAMILYHLIITLFGNAFLALTGLTPESRYAIIGTLRAIVHVISLDIYITVLYALLVFISQSTNFHDFAEAQNMS